MEEFRVIVVVQPLTKSNAGAKALHSPTPDFISI